MGQPVTDFQVSSELRRGQMILHYEVRYDVVTLAYRNVTIETEADVAWFVEGCDAFWKRFDGDKLAHERKDLLVDMDGIVVKPRVAAAFNAARGRMTEKYLGKTYRYGGERRTITAVHLGHVLQKVDGTIYADREAALAALLADRAAAKKS
jgi:hypothetical protein